MTWVPIRKLFHLDPSKRSRSLAHTFRNTLYTSTVLFVDFLFLTNVGHFVKAQYLTFCPWNSISQDPSKASHSLIKLLSWANGTDHYSPPQLHLCAADKWLKSNEPYLKEEPVLLSVYSPELSRDIVIYCRCWFYIKVAIIPRVVALVMVSVLAIGPKGRWFEPDQGDRILWR
jgi:hypothetical protein